MFFEAKFRDAKVLTTLLKAMNYSQTVICLFNSQGARFTVEASKSVQSHAYLPKSAFSQYDLITESEDENLEIGVDLNVLIECLSMFSGASGNTGNGTATHSKAAPVPLLMRCVDPSEFCLTLEEGNVVTECQLKTFETEPLVDMNANFRETSVNSKIIMISRWLRDAFNELDSTAEKTIFLRSPQEPFFRLSASGLSGDTIIDYPKDNEVLESFTCQERAETAYSSSLLQHALKALCISTKTSIRINKAGFLSMQFMIPTPDKETLFLEFMVFSVNDFKCSPLEEDEEEE
ncbi:ssDNA endodeoxyribonuclease [Phlyctochytrium planicorne]|nr:ssDNA endodeoxyribonuclease [Phlyctochytrium planicorne]